MGRAVLVVANVRHMSLVLSATLAKLGSGVSEPTAAQVSCIIIIIIKVNSSPRQYAISKR